MTCWHCDGTNLKVNWDHLAVSDTAHAITQVQFKNLLLFNHQNKNDYKKTY